jgi:hypothetical protein
MPRVRAAFVALVLTLAPASLEAQMQFAISGFAGAYLPAGELFETIFTDTYFNLSQKTSLAVGGRLAVWPSSRVAIEAEFAYLPSGHGGDVIQTVGGVLEQDTIDSDANLFVGSVSVVYALIRPPLEPLAFYVSGGVGLVSRSGDFFDDLKGGGIDVGTSDIAGVIGLGLRYGVGKGVWLRGDFRDYISSFKLVEEEGIEMDSKIQNDILLTAGLEFVFGG